LLSGRLGVVVLGVVLPVLDLVLVDEFLDVRDVELGHLQWSKVSTHDQEEGNREGGIESRTEWEEKEKKTHPDHFVGGLSASAGAVRRTTPSSNGLVDRLRRIFSVRVDEARERKAAYASRKTAVLPDVDSVILVIELGVLGGVTLALVDLKFDHGGAGTGKEERAGEVRVGKKSGTERM
jgi:hypothetical protein